MRTVQTKHDISKCDCGVKKRFVFFSHYFLSTSTLNQSRQERTVEKNKNNGWVGANKNIFFCWDSATRAGFGAHSLGTP